MSKYDVVIVGGGPGGYVAAIRAAKSGLATALIEYDELGGTCLNRGCIPSKTYLKHGEVLETIQQANQYAIQIDNSRLDMPKVVSRKNNVIKQLNSGIKGLLRQNKVYVYDGYGYVNEDKSIQIKTESNEKTIYAENIVIATGSSVAIPPIEGVEDVPYDTSNTIFNLEEVPESMIIVGGGVIGVEIACAFNVFGTDVTIIEMADRILPLEDEEAAAFLQKELKDKGIAIHTSSQVTEMRNTGNKQALKVTRDNQDINLDADKILMCVGRKPNKTGLDNLALDYEGPFVKVNKHNGTNIEGIYAIGDVVGGYQLAHVASEEGIKVVDYILGRKQKSKAFTPRCVYSFPEIASVGLTEKEAKAKGIDIAVKKIDLAANGKAIAASENKGFMKIIADKKYNEVVGVVMVGSHVTEMISQATATMFLEGTVDELASMIFPHPTVSEGLFEAANAFLDKGIHYT